MQGFESLGSIQCEAWEANANHPTVTYILMAACCRTLPVHTVRFTRCSHNTNKEDGATHIMPKKIHIFIKNNVSFNGGNITTEKYKLVGSPDGQK